MMTEPRPLEWPPVFPLQKGLVLWLPFDDRSGARACDRSGKGNHATLYGPTWAAGRRGSVLDFDGNDYAEVPFISGLTKLTVTFLLKYVTAGDYTFLVSQGLSGYAGFRTWDVYMLGSDRKIYLQLSLNGTTTQTAVGATALSANTLYFVAATYDGSNLIVTINSTPGTPLAAAGSINQVNRTIHIGKPRYAAANYLTGTMSNICLYNRGLNAAELKRRCESELMLVRH